MFLAAIRLSLSSLGILASASQVVATISGFSSAMRALYLSAVMFTCG